MLIVRTQPLTPKKPILKQFRFVRCFKTRLNCRPPAIPLKKKSRQIPSMVSWFLAHTKLHPVSPGACNLVPTSMARWRRGWSIAVPSRLSTRVLPPRSVGRVVSKPVKRTQKYFKWMEMVERKVPPKIARSGFPILSKKILKISLKN